LDGRQNALYPIEYVGTNWYREEMSPYGYLDGKVRTYAELHTNAMQYNSIGLARTNECICLVFGYQLLSYFLLTLHIIFYLTTGRSDENQSHGGTVGQNYLERLLSLQEAFGRLQPTNYRLYYPPYPKLCD
jgi:hypothetical protein